MAWIPASFTLIIPICLLVRIVVQFAEQLNEIVRECPEERQTLLFSATMPKMLLQFSRAGLRDPQLIRLDTDVKMSEELRLGFFSIRSNEKVGKRIFYDASVKMYNGFPLIL
jgi:superfamily II DNA/RNA helicase